jgi:hypothetical protein
VIHPLLDIVILVTGIDFVFEGSWNFTRTSPTKTKAGQSRNKTDRQGLQPAFDI